MAFLGSKCLNELTEQKLVNVSSGPEGKQLYYPDVNLCEQVRTSSQNNNEKREQLKAVATLCRKRGASGAESPYWQAIVSFEGRKIWVSTKCRDFGAARKVSNYWSEAAELAQDHELSQVECDKLIARISRRVTTSPKTLAKSRELFKRLLLESTGEVYEGQDFAEFCQEWLRLRSANIKGATMVKYVNVTNAFIASLPERRRHASVDSISTPDVRRYRDGLIAEGISKSTANVSLAIVRSIFTDACRQGVAQRNPALAVPAFKMCDPDERLPFSAEQIKALLSVADEEWKGMILFACQCGLRLSDVASLKWSSIDLISRTLAYRAQKTSHRKKRESDRTTVVALHEDVVNYLMRLAGNDDAAAPLFPALYGQPTTGTDGLSPQFGRIMKAAGIEAPRGAKKRGRGRQFRQLSFHSLRHSFISRLANAEVSPEIRKQMAGHSGASDEVHSGYTHLGIDLQKAAIAKLESVMS